MRTTSSFSAHRTLYYHHLSGSTAFSLQRATHRPPSEGKAKPTTWSLTCVVGFYFGGIVSYTHPSKMRMSKVEEMIISQFIRDEIIFIHCPSEWEARRLRYRMRGFIHHWAAEPRIYKTRIRGLELTVWNVLKFGPKPEFHKSPLLEFYIPVDNVEEVVNKATRIISSIDDEDKLKDEVRRAVLAKLHSSSGANQNKRRKT